MKIIGDIACYFQSTYTFNEIDEILSHFDLPEESHQNFSINSKRVYVQHRLKGVSEEVLRRIIYEFEIPVENIFKTPPKNWENSDQVKVFISHLSKDKNKAISLKKALEAYNIKAFVAHEDIHPTEKWAKEISNALACMDIFISMHTAGFEKSIWCQQEVGYAFASGKKIIPIKFEENPSGFISSIQALPRKKRTAMEVVNEILKILKNNPQTKELFEKIINKPEEISANDLPF